MQHFSVFLFHSPSPFILTTTCKLDAFSIDIIWFEVNYHAQCCDDCDMNHRNDLLYWLASFEQLQQKVKYFIIGNIGDCEYVWVMLHYYYCVHNFVQYLSNSQKKYECNVTINVDMCRCIWNSIKYCVSKKEQSYRAQKKLLLKFGVI